MELRALELLLSLQATGGFLVTSADDRLANPNCLRRYQQLIKNIRITNSHGTFSHHGFTFRERGKGEAGLGNDFTETNKKC